MSRHFLARRNVAGEVVVGDNGSSDGSQDIARSLEARVAPLVTVVTLEGVQKDSDEALTASQ